MTHFMSNDQSISIKQSVPIWCHCSSVPSFPNANAVTINNWQCPDHAAGVSFGPSLRGPTQRCRLCGQQASDDERYTLSELKEDVGDCRARYVHIVVDQSYSGTLLRSLRRSRRHQHVAVYASGRDSEYSFGDQFTAAWTRVNHTRLCMNDVFRVSRPPSSPPQPLRHGITAFDQAAASYMPDVRRATRVPESSESSVQPEP